jgi:hypothetical protein
MSSSVFVGSPCLRFLPSGQSRSRGVKKSKSWEFETGRDPIFLWPLRGLWRPGATLENTKNSTIEASMLLKTKEGVGKRTQNELNFECQMRALIPKSGPSESSSNSLGPSGARNLAQGLPVSKHPGRAKSLALICRKPRPSRASGNLPTDAIYVGYFLGSAGRRLGKSKLLALDCPPSEGSSA